MVKHEWERQHLGPISIHKSKDKIFIIIFYSISRLYQARKNVKIRQETQQFLKGFTILFYLCLYVTNIQKVRIFKTVGFFSALFCSFSTGNNIKQTNKNSFEHLRRKLRNHELVR